MYLEYFTFYHSQEHVCAYLIKSSYCYTIRPWDRLQHYIYLNRQMYIGITLFVRLSVQLCPDYIFFMEKKLEVLHKMTLRYVMILTIGHLKKFKIIGKKKFIICVRSMPSLWRNIWHSQFSLKIVYDLGCVKNLTKVKLFKCLKKCILPVNVISCNGMENNQRKINIFTYM